ncbi:MAG: hypothetical protein KAX39_02075 [candidate division Zixibacteria bacterium]|nr:hypothetical protein [candidate division Zixibacteria bacterium]
MFLKVNRRSAQAKACGYIHPFYPLNPLTNPFHLFNLLGNLLGISFPYFFLDRDALKQYYRIKSVALKSQDGGLHVQGQEFYLRYLDHFIVFSLCVLCSPTQ